jgi:hypothetical protein
VLQITDTSLKFVEYQGFGIIATEFLITCQKPTRGALEPLGVRRRLSTSDLSTLASTQSARTRPPASTEAAPIPDSGGDDNSMPDWAVALTISGACLIRSVHVDTVLY